MCSSALKFVNRFANGRLLCDRGNRQVGLKKVNSVDFEANTWLGERLASGSTVSRKVLMGTEIVQWSRQKTRTIQKIDYLNRKRHELRVRIRFHIERLLHVPVNDIVHENTLYKMDRRLEG